jgi:hypothetical protein
MNNFTRLCKEIDIPAQVEGILQGTNLPFDEKQTDLLINQLTKKDQYSSASPWLKQFAWPVQLKVMLMAALVTEKQYEVLGIDHCIFVDTLKCFSRFIIEHKTSYGEYGFDRSFWVGRQLSCLLFRLGELEFELSTLEEKPAISIHIPSDCDMTPSKLDESFNFAKNFFASKFSDYANAPFFCYSWLNSPNLKLVLPETSKIIMFQNRFEIVKVDEESDGYVQWVFKNKNLPPQDFPENTSLQKNIKRHILNGGKIGEALGILTNFDNSY